MNIIIFIPRNEIIIIKAVILSCSERRSRAHLHMNKQTLEMRIESAENVEVFWDIKSAGSVTQSNAGSEMQAKQN